MRTSRSSLTLVAAGAAVWAGVCAAPGGASQADPPPAAYSRGDPAEDVIRGWSDFSALAARRLLEQYGSPDEIHYGRLVWNGRGPWKRIVARDVRPVPGGPEELGLVEQTLAWKLSPGAAADVQSFDPRLAYDPRLGELSARSDREETNFLLMNLADDVARRRLTARQARDSYASLLSLEASGKSSPYLLSLRFAPPAP